MEAEVDGWLHCVNRYGIKGLVPASYIRLLGSNESPVDVAQQLFGGSYGLSQVSKPFGASKWEGFGRTRIALLGMLTQTWLVELENKVKGT